MRIDSVEHAMTDTLSRLLAVDALPRGERLAMRGWGIDFLGSQSWRLCRGDVDKARRGGPCAVRAYAAPLALARERRRRERAEEKAQHLAWQRDEWRKERDDERAARLRWESDALALRAEVDRLRAAVPTRAEVEAAVDALLECPEKCGDMDAARAALVALATRGTG
jgi:hypothetical protein